MLSSKKKDAKNKIALKKQSKKATYLKEIYGIILVGIVLFLTLSITSNNPNDPTLFTYIAGHDVVTNLAGSLGANLADIFLYFLGSAVYALIGCLAIYAYLLLYIAFEAEPERAQELKMRLKRNFWLSPVMIMCSAALCSFYSIDFSKSYPGGLIGSFVAGRLFTLLGFFGSVIMLWAVFWTSLTLLLRRSLIKDCAWVLKLVGGLVWGVVQKVYAACKGVMTFRFKQAEKEREDLKDFLHVFKKQEAPIPQAILEKEPEAKAIDTFWDQYSAKTSPVRVSKPVVFETIKQGRDVLLQSLEYVMQRKSRRSPSFSLPTLSLFAQSGRSSADEQVSSEAVMRGQKLEEKLQHFGVKGEVKEIKPGPLITMFEYQPEIDSKISKITALEDDLAMALSAVSIRTIAPIPGKNAVGFEISNKDRKDVFFSDVVNSSKFTKSNLKLPMALGVDVIGNPVVEDLAKMPHLLIGGTTGSGKSVGLNAMLSSLLCQKKPDEMKLILIDPKRLEFTPYADVPHLLFPIVTNPVKATAVLKWVVQEMEERYEKMAEFGARNLAEFNRNAPSKECETLPFIVVIIDELADLMIVSGKEVETHIVRIAQMARAAGIHMIVATQRPSVDVVTGLIKVNFPSRVAFRVSSKVDSRTIIDMQGAEKLLGRGDLLFKNSSSPHVHRVHGAYISDPEIEKLADHLRSQGEPDYLDINEVVRQVNKSDEPQDELYPEIVEWLKTTDEISISMLQRQYRIGFNRSARIIEQLEMDGIIAPAQGSKPRKVLRN